MRKNDIPFEHQMMFIIRNYDSVVAENTELRKEVEELSGALEELGGEDERKSLKKKVARLLQKNDSLTEKLTEKSQKYEAACHQLQVAKNRQKLLVKCLKLTRKKIVDMLALVEVPALKKLVNHISNDLMTVQTSTCLYADMDIDNV